MPLCEGCSLCCCDPQSFNSPPWFPSSSDPFCHHWLPYPARVSWLLISPIYLLLSLKSLLSWHLNVPTLTSNLYTNGTISSAWRRRPCLSDFTWWLRGICCSQCPKWGRFSSRWPQWIQVYFELAEFLRLLRLLWSSPENVNDTSIILPNLFVSRVQFWWTIMKTVQMTYKNVSKQVRFGNFFYQQMDFDFISITWTWPLVKGQLKLLIDYTYFAYKCNYIKPVIWRPNLCCRTTDRCNNINESKKNDVNWKKPDKKGTKLCTSIYIRS